MKQALRFGTDDVKYWVDMSGKEPMEFGFVDVPLLTNLLKEMLLGLAWFGCWLLAVVSSVAFSELLPLLISDFD